MSASKASPENSWPHLPLSEWIDTCETLHMWTQIVGKIRMAQTPAANHWWHVPLYLTSRGLTSSPIPYGNSSFQIDFDFIDHKLSVMTEEGAVESFVLAGHSVASFYGQIMDLLQKLGKTIKIRTIPDEVEDKTPFESDTHHASYDPTYAYRFWKLLAQSSRVFNSMRSEFLGKTSPVHFFWGSFDLAMSRFSGREAPLHPGITGVPNSITWEAYSHELSSCGFWPGNRTFPTPLFYAYAYPEPAGFAEAPIKPAYAYYDKTLREFVLPYERLCDDAFATDSLQIFLRTAYEAGARLGRWDQVHLERQGPSATGYRMLSPDSAHYLPQASYDISNPS